MLALVLGGGNALGAYHGGVAEALETATILPEWIAGASIGAVTAALMAGNPPERRVAAIREFWRRGALPDPTAHWMPDFLRNGIHATAALQSRIIGRPLLFHLRFSQLLRGDRNPGLYDREPMRRALAELIDFDLLNSGKTRVSILAVDVETGAEVPFDTTRDRITVDHLMASCGLIPDFPAVEVEGRALVDGGLASNTPVDLVLMEPASEPVACFSADPFPLKAPRPRRLADAAERQNDLAFGVQTARTLRAMQQLWEARGEGPAGAVYCMNYEYQVGEVAMKTYDFAQSSLDRRWQRGRADMERALAIWREAPPLGRGLAIHAVTGATPQVAK